jgi:hypothetical protein
MATQTLQLKPIGLNFPKFCRVQQIFIELPDASRFTVESVREESAARS